jgi:hypothetical protein
MSAATFDVDLAGAQFDSGSTETSTTDCFGQMTSPEPIWQWMEDWTDATREC